MRFAALARSLSRTLVAMSAVGPRMLQAQRWAVIGDVLNSRKPASTVVECLRAAGKSVTLINPRDKGVSSSPDAALLHTSLADVGDPIDVVNLIVNPKDGLKQVEAMAGRGVKQLWVQPGASSPEIVEAAAGMGVEVHHGCVLIEGPPFWSSKL